MKKTMGIPTAPKKTQSPPQISAEIRAQFRRRISPIPVAMPKTARHIMNPSVASMALLTNGWASTGLAGKVFNSVPKNASEQHKRTKRPARMATMAAAIVDAEGFEESAIAYLYITSLEKGTSCAGEVDAEENRA